MIMRFVKRLLIILAKIVMLLLILIVGIIWVLLRALSAVGGCLLYPSIICLFILAIFNATQGWIDDMWLMIIMAVILAALAFLGGLIIEGLTNLLGRMMYFVRWG